MDEQNGPANGEGGNGFRSFILSFLAGLARDALKMVVAFGVGTAGGALVCWYYGLPIGLSLLGGILTLGLALALTTDSWFS